jgi:DNA-binding NarL/FixJ family response regulator
LVDDVPDLRMLIRIALQSDGRFEIVGEAGDGREAARLAGELQPDAVLLDLAMPRMDGLTAIPEIHQACPHTRILAYSGFETGPVALRVIEICGDAYIEKGAHPERIAEVFYQVATSPPKTLGVVRS